MTVLSGLATTGVTLFFARLGAGVAEVEPAPGAGSAARRQVPDRHRAAGSRQPLSVAGRVTGTLSPLLVGGIAAWPVDRPGGGGRSSSSRSRSAIAAFFAFRLPEPPRGQFEKQDVLGEVIEDGRPAPISMEAAFSRLMQIRTIRMTRSSPSRRWASGCSPCRSSPTSSWRTSTDSTRSAVARWHRRAASPCSSPCRSSGATTTGSTGVDPSKALRLVGLLVLPAAAAHAGAVLHAEPGAVRDPRHPAAVLLSASFAMVGPILTSVVPYRLRGMGSALGAIYIFFVGATGGAVLAGLLVNAYGARTAVIVIFVPATIIGGLLILRSSTFIQDDLAMIVARDPRGARRARAPASPIRRRPGAAGQPRRLLLRPGADPVRRRVRGPQGRGAGAARHERRRQVDDPAGHRRARHPVARRGSPPRPVDHLRLARDADQARHPHAAGRQGRLRRHDHPREPRDGDVQPAHRPRRR